MDNCSVVAVTVTFNDFGYLCRLLDSLEKQTVQLNKIVVIDNCSKPEIREELEKKRSSLIDIVYMDENRGGAGGFEAGMLYAKEKYAADWYWIMDADAFPKPDCLEQLLRYRNKTDGILVPLILGAELNEYQLYHHKKLSRFLNRDIHAFNSYEEIPDVAPIEASAFVGPLISGKAVEELGVADGSLFIYGDDLEYTYRVSRKYPVLLVKNAVINHRDLQADGTQLPTAWWKDYYSYRNRGLFIRKYKRNLFTGIAGFAILFYHCVRHAAYAAIKLRYKFKELLVLWNCIFKGFTHGMIGKSGKTLDPVEFGKRIRKLQKQGQE